MNIVSLAAAHPFERSPAPLQRPLINTLEKWYDSQSMSALLWSPKNALLQMEFSRQVRVCHSHLPTFLTVASHAHLCKIR